MPDPQLTVRPAAPADAGAVRQLAALERRLAPHGHVLIAERDDVAVAAIALTSGVLVTDPFRATADAVRSLRLRRWRLLRRSSRAAAAPSVLRRVAAVPAV